MTSDDGGFLFRMASMKFTFWFSLMAAFVVPAIVSCSSSSPGAESAWSKATGNFYYGLEEAASLEGVKVPVLRSPAYEAKWGKPKIRTTTAGDYELNYANPDQPFDRLAIQGTSRPFPKLTKVPKVSGEKMINDELTGVLIPQEFRTVMIAGQSVRWFQESLSGGADGAYYTTEGFALKDAFGNTGFYRLVAEGGNNADAEVAKRFGSVKFKE